MVLVTGGTGLLGTHLILALHAQGIRARALYRSAIPPVVKDKAEWITGDILDVLALEEAMQDVQQVYHCAGLVSFHPRDKQALHRVNAGGTANVVNACLDAGVQKLVHVSSVAALGRIRQDVVITEAMNWTEETSNSVYGKTKFLAEMEVWRGIGEGLNAVMVNPTIVIGEHGDWSKGSMQIFQSLYRGFPWYSLGKTGFVDANDVARAMIQLMEADVQNERFILSAENIYYRDLFFMIADAFGVKRPYRQVTPFKAQLAWRMEKIKSMLGSQSPLVTRETARTGLAEVNFDNSKLLKALPEFQYQPIAQSIERICRILQQHEVK